MSQPLPSTESAAGAIARVKYSHDAMIDLVIANPAIKQIEIARYFGYTDAWVSRIFCSDAFQARLAQRKDELVNPVIGQAVEDRIKGVAMLSLDILEEKLASTRSADLALKAFDLSSKAAGYGARSQNVAVQNTFVVALPAKAADAHAWADSHRPTGQAIEAPVRELIAPPGQTDATATQPQAYQPVREA